MSITDIITERLSWWYELNWRAGVRPAFILRIDTSALVDLFKNIQRGRMCSRFEVLDPKVRLGTERVGFDRQPEENGIIGYRFELPVLKNDGEYDWNLGAQAAQVMAEMLDRVSCVRGERGLRPQLLKVVTAAHPNRVANQYPVTGEASPIFRRWVIEQSDGASHLARQAMQEAYRHMVGAPLSGKDFHAELHPAGGFVLGVPGFAPMVGASGADQRTGYRFASHNVANPWEQLALLAGVARLWESAAFDIPDAS